MTKRILIDSKDGVIAESVIRDVNRLDEVVHNVPNFEIGKVSMVPESPSAPTVPATPAPAPPAPPAPQAAPPAPAPQKPAGDPRPRSQRLAAPPPAPDQKPAPSTEPPAAPPAPPEAKQPPAPPPEPPEPASKPQRSEAEIAKELEDRRVAQEKADADAAKVAESKAFLQNAKVTARDLFRDTEATEKDVLDLIDKLVDEGLETGKILAAEDADNAGVQQVVARHEAFKGEVVDSYFEAIPESMQEAFIAKVNNKPAGDWVKALLEIAPTLPAVKEAVYNDALATAQGLVPEGSRADFDAELGKASKDLKGLLHAAYQAGVMTDTPRGSRPVAETGGGAMDIERWRADRSFRRTLTREENQRYHNESMRLQKEAAGL